MKLNDFMNGLKILSGYFSTLDGCHLGAEHDEIYVYSTDKPLTTEDVKKMIDLGWHQEYPERDYDNFGLEDYRAGEGWKAYV